jgi:hypothetical protein
MFKTNTMPNQYLPEHARRTCKSRGCSLTALDATFAAAAAAAAMRFMSNNGQLIIFARTMWFKQ